MKRLVAKLRPSTGFSPFLHRLINGLFAIAVLALVKADFTSVAVALVALAKWRIFAVKPRYWLTNIRSNMMDLSVGFAVIIFLGSAVNNFWLQIAWTVFYAFWLVILKPMSSRWAVMSQAAIGQLLGLTAFFWHFRDASTLSMMVVTWLLCYSAARHFLSAYEEEPLAKIIAHVWAVFAAQLAWILGHWIIFYRFLPQLSLLLAAFGYGLGALYYLYKNEKLTTSLRLQFILSLSAFTIVIIALSDWQDKTIL